MPKRSDITIPRLDGERAERYAARVAYITAGPGRSLEAVRQKAGLRPATIRRIERWSAADNWPGLAAEYDQTVYTLAAQDAADQYRADLAAHRQRAMDSAQALFKVVTQQLDRFTQAPHAVELNASTLAAVRAALISSLDLEAHALGIDLLQQRLEGQDDRSGI